MSVRLHDYDHQDQFATRRVSKQQQPYPAPTPAPIFAPSTSNQPATANHPPNTSQLGHYQRPQPTTKDTAAKTVCCFPAFWFLLLILAFVLGTFFIIVGKDKIGRVDWRQVNNNTEQATSTPNDSKAILNSTPLNTANHSHKLQFNRQDSYMHQLKQQMQSHKLKYHKIENNNKIGHKNIKNKRVSHNLNINNQGKRHQLFGDSLLRDSEQ